MGWELIVFAIVAVAALAASAAGAYMQYQQGQQQKKVAKYNAENMANQAERQKQLAATRAEDIRQRNRVMLAREEAAAGASGLAAEPGTSPLAVMAYDAREGELDALRAQWYGDVNAEALTANARMQRFGGANAAYAANWGAGTTLLGGVAQAGSSGLMLYGATSSPRSGLSTQAGRDYSSSWGEYK